jgi:hypothetical protein
MKRICWIGFDKWASDKNIARLITDNMPGLNVGMFRPGKKPFVFLEFQTDADY